MDKKPTYLGSVDVRIHGYVAENIYCRFHVDVEYTVSVAAVPSVLPKEETVDIFSRDVLPGEEALARIRAYIDGCNDTVAVLVKEGLAKSLPSLPGDVSRKTEACPCPVLCDACANGKAPRCWKVEISGMANGDCEKNR